uniref:Uncharacterized protein n=1 Tax=Schistosoma haematobium TaxID=6185 RepID=A0A094ZU78_SCHHA
MTAFQELNGVCLIPGKCSKQFQHLHSSTLGLTTFAKQLRQ